MKNKIKYLKFSFILIVILMLTHSLSVQSQIILGNNDAGTSNDPPGTSMGAIRYQCTQNMTATTMKVNISTSGSGYIKCAIYADNSGNPGTFLIGTNQLTNPGTGWKTFTFTTGLALTSGTWYHLVVWTNNTGYQVRYTAGGVGTPYRSLTYGTWPSPFGTTTPWTTGTYCMYAEGSGSCTNPAITAQPQSITRCTGTSATFSVTATGTSLTYQWKKGGSNISGATSSSYTISSVVTGDAANYTVVVSGACGSPVTSNTATLTVSTPPSITAQPQSITRCIGTSAAFSVTATGTTLTYQWKKGGTNISGATSSSYTISSVVTGDAANYTVVVSGSCGSPVTSNTATLTVSTPPSITTQPQSITRNVGQSAPFSVTAIGTSLTYQWKKGGTNISGATSSSYTISSVVSGDAGDYTVVVSGACGSPVTSNTATLTVGTIITLGNNAEGTLTDLPYDAMSVIRYQCTQTMTASKMYVKIAASGSGYIKCAIYADNSGVPGAFLMGTNQLTNPGTGWKSFDLTSGLALISGTWYHLVLWTNSTGYQINYTAGGVGTPWRGLTYGAWPDPFGTSTPWTGGTYCIYAEGTGSGCINPTITTQPQSITRCIGTAATFSVTATGTSLTYQWKKEGANISGATSSSYTISSVASGDAANYTVVVNGACGSPVTSNTATLTVSTPPSITAQPQSITRAVGTSATFNVTATGTSLSYQWKKGGSNISGQTASTYTIASVGTADAGNYTVVVSGACGSPTISSTAVLTVNSGVTADYYVATNGSDSYPGTLAQPFATWQKGFASLTAGKTLCIRGGTYTGFQSWNGSQWVAYGGSYNAVRITGINGTSGSHITAMAYPGEYPVLDCATLAGNGPRAGIRFENCSYWDIKGLEVKNVREYTGTAIFGIWSMDTNSNMTYENCSGHGSSGGWACDSNSDNIYYTNCDSYENADYFDNGGFTNGFSITVGSGKHVYYNGCRAWSNSDDGWDCFTRDYGGGYIEIKNCWAFENGAWDGEYGNGVGIKTGLSVQPPSDAVARRVLNCLSFYNTMAGFDESQDSGEANDNSMPTQIFNCTSYHNGATSVGGAFNFPWAAGESGINRPDYIRNNISYDERLGDINASNYVDHNSWQDGLSVTSADFVSLSYTGAKGARQSDGSLPNLNFLKLVSPDSDLIGAGIDVGLPFIGPHPDLGAFESSDNTKSAEINLTGNPELIGDNGSFIIYPNPVKDKLTIAIKDKDKQVSLKLYNSNGIKLYEEIVIGNSIIDMRSYASGLYFLNVGSIGDLKVVKIVK